MHVGLNARLHAYASTFPALCLIPGLPLTACYMYDVEVDLHAVESICCVRAC
jgi:hypothetical protein